MVCLDPIEILSSFSIVNKKFYTVFHEYMEVYLRSLTSVEKKIRNPLKVLLKLADPFKKKSLNILGFGTTGGLFKDAVKHWVNNMYDPKKSKGYFSRERASNIITAGVLAHTQQEIANIKTAQRELLALCREISEIKAQKIEQIIRILQNVELGYNFVFNQHMQILKSYLFHEFECSEAYRMEKEFKIDQIFEIYRSTQLNLEASFRHPDNKFVIERSIDTQTADLMAQVFVANEIVISRPSDGMNPIEILMVFVSDTYVDIESSQFSAYNDICYPHALDSKLKLVSDNGNTYVLFKPTRNNLKPLTWVKFNEHDNKLNITLPYSVSGVYLYTKLIKASMHNNENVQRMDINSVLLKGWRIKIS